MHLFLFYAFCLLLSCAGCSPSQYPRLKDVPTYTPPSISIEQAQKEIFELKAERAGSSSSQNTNA